ncbi:MAG: hypothetical protein JTT13_04225 [Candidatus Brockarchaeota archaeon]|nr:hypothetical protein [Candidatus Brockarchaeota archaeon]
MGQLSAELNYERRLERYEEEWEERIIKSENWEEELERYLKEAMERWEEIEGQEEEPKVEAKEYEDSSLLMMEGNLSEDEKREGKEYMKEERKEKERGIVTITSGRPVLLHKPRKENKGIEAVETEDHLRELIEAIETLAEEGSLQREEKLENLAEELSGEEKRQEELCREELFKATARKIEAEAESEDPLERLFEEPMKSKEIKERVEKLSKSIEYEKLKEEYEEPIEELDILEEKFEELMGEEGSLEKVCESFEEAGEEPVEEPVEKGVKEVVKEEVKEPLEKEVEKLVEERAEELIEKAEEEAEVEEVSEVAEGIGESVEEVSERVDEEAEESVEEEVEEGTEELVEEAGEEKAESVEKGVKELVEEAEVERVDEEAVPKEVREEPSGIVNYSDGLRVKCILKRKSDRIRIYVLKDRLESYLGNEACWVKIVVKDRMVYREYDPSTYRFNLPVDIGEDGEEAEVAIVKIITCEFIKTALREAKAPFDIVFDSEKYKLVMNGKEVCYLTLKREMYYDKGDHGPAVVFAITDWEGKEHLIKLVYKNSEEYLCRVKTGDFRRIKNVEYNNKNRSLTIEYSIGEEMHSHTVFFVTPEPALLKLIMIRSLLMSGVSPNDTRITGLEGEIGEDYVRFHLVEVIKEIVSRLAGIPKEELEVIPGKRSWGPDFEVRHKGKLVAVVEVKTTISSDYLTDRLEKAIGKLRGYFTKEEWKEEYGDAKYGIPIVVFLEDINKIIETGFEEGVKLIKGDIVQNTDC